MIAWSYYREDRAARRYAARSFVVSVVGTLAVFGGALLRWYA